MQRAKRIVVIGDPHTDVLQSTDITVKIAVRHGLHRPKCNLTVSSRIRPQVVTT